MGKSGKKNFGFLQKNLDLKDALILKNSLLSIEKMHIERYRFAVNKINEYFKNKRSLKILDCASGSGYGTYYLAQNFKNSKVYGVDLSKKAVNIAKKFYKRKNIRYLIKDAQKLDFKQNYFDVVISFETIEHLKEPKLFLRNIKNILSKKGILIISTPNKFYTFHPEFHFYEFSEKEFFELLQKYFKIKEKYYQFENYIARLYYTFLAFLFKIKFKEKFPYLFNLLKKVKAIFLEKNKNFKDKDIKNLPKITDYNKFFLEYPKSSNLNSIWGIKRIFIGLCQKN